MTQLSAERRYCLIMPFFNEAEHLPAVLDSLAAQTLPAARWRLVAVDDGSTDGSGALVARAFASGRFEGSLVPAGGHSIPAALNRALQEVASDEFVVRLDAHTLYAADYIAKIDRGFAELPESAWCIGAGPEPLAAGGFGRSLQVALYTNRFGLGPADFRGRAGRRPVRVSTVYLGAYRPGVLQRLGGFDPRWLANEDCELTERIAAAGGLIYRIPLRAGLIVTRGPVTTVRKFAKYGFWRAQTFKRYPRAIRLRHLVPPAALCGAALLTFTRYRALLGAGAALYGLGVVLSRGRGEPPAVTAGCLLFFPAVHVAYAAGLLAGVFRTPAGLRGPRARKSPASPLTNAS